MERPILILLTIWAMVAAPTLCSGGLLVHHCDHETDVEHEGHDSGNPTDPCNQDMIRHNDEESSLTIHELLPLAAPLTVADRCAAFLDDEPSPFSDESLPRLNLQYHPSDRPLLN